MKLNTLLSIVFCLLLTLASAPGACAKDKELPYMRNGISFSLAEDWKIIANDSIGENAYYFSAESERIKSSGLITVTWANQLEDPQKTMLNHQQSMKNANIYRNPGIEFTAIIPDDFAGQKVLVCSYTTIVKDQKLEGRIYCFNSSKKTITLFFQTGLSDQKLNLKALELLRKTFNCRE